MFSILGTEPTLILGLVRAVLVAAMAFGLELSEEQFVALYALVEAIISVVNRSQVSPVETLDEVE